MKLKIILMISLISLFACNSLGPKPTRKIKIWNGSPEEIGICRLTNEDTAEFKCIDADKEEFKKYGCLTFDDIGYWQEYIALLRKSCRKWRK